MPLEFEASGSVGWVKAISNILLRSSAGKRANGEFFNPLLLATWSSASAYSISAVSERDAALLSVVLIDLVVALLDARACINSEILVTGATLVSRRRFEDPGSGGD